MIGKIASKLATWERRTRTKDVLAIQSGLIRVQGKRIDTLEERLKLLEQKSKLSAGRL